MNTRVSVLCTVLVILGCCGGSGVGRAQHEREPVLDPRSYHSPSGQYTLWIDPSERFGSGPARYRLTVGPDEREVWAGQRPLTFSDAAVLDDGRVVGCGCTLGRDTPYFENRGDFFVAAFDGRGRLGWQEKTPRYLPNFLHATPLPTNANILADPARDRVYVLTADAGGKVYRLTDGRRLGECDFTKLLPAEVTRKVYHQFTGACLLSGSTGCLVVRWRLGAGGSRFALIDPAPPGGTVVWSEVWKRDSTLPSDTAPDAIVPGASAADGFSLWDGRKGERVDYILEGGGGTPASRRVRETARQAAPAPVPDPHAPVVAEPALPEGRLRALGTFAVRTAGGVAAPAVRSVEAFGFDGTGRIGFLRQEAGKTAFVLVESEGGQTVREVGLDALDTAGGKLALAWNGPGDHWVITLSRNDNRPTLAWLIDAGAGTLTAVEGFDSPYVKALAGAGDGRFVVLGADYRSHTVEELLIGYAPDGSQRWKVVGSYETLFSPTDVAVTDEAGTGRKVAVVLETIGEHVGFFDLADGRLLRRIDLKKTWGRESNYLASLCADVDGGLVVEDFQGRAPYVRMTAGGTVRAEFKPVSPAGHSFNGETVRYDPVGGALWISDRNNLMRLDAEGGKVDRVLGAPSGDDRLGRIAALTVDERGQVYAVDDATGAVHVFDAEGRRLRVMHPLPAEWEPGSWPSVAAAPDGRFFLGLERTTAREGAASGSAVEFDSDGRRLGTRTAGAADLRHWYFQGTASRDALVGTSFEDACLTALDGSSRQAPCPLPRRADGCWLQAPRTVGVAPDGSFAVLSGPIFGSSGAPVMNVFGAAGTPRRAFPLPPSFNSYFFAYNGRQLAARRGGQLVVFDARTGAGVMAFEPELSGKPGADLEGWQAFSTLGGKELWLVEGSAGVVARFAWPE